MPKEDLLTKLSEIKLLKNQAINEQKFEYAANLSDIEKSFLSQLKEEESQDMEISIVAKSAPVA